jgi:hypothetical protein
MAIKSFISARRAGGGQRGGGLNYVISGLGKSLITMMEAMMD